MRSKITLGFASLISAALVLSGCSTSDDTATESTSANGAETSASTESATASGTLSDGTPYVGERVTLERGSDADAPDISVSLPPTWRHGQDVDSGLVDLLKSEQPEASGYTPEIAVSVEKQESTDPTDALAGARGTVSELDGWNEVKYTDIEVDGQRGFRLAGTWVSPDVDVPVYAVMTVVAYQSEAEAPVHLVVLKNQFTNVENMETSNQVEEINTSLEFS